MADDGAAGGDGAVWKVVLRVRGRVQGVFFRAAAQQRAAQLGAAGWVRNCDDGSVQLAAYGPRAAVRALDAWARAGGPPAARVTGVVDEAAAAAVAPGEDVPTSFEIRRGGGGGG